ncbi:j-binding protein, putative [Trypanosoma brucei gambiense DAL972]|uniref:Thymine dioxygenase JBP1 n=2 Tax=Trypanosoma brucei TaxID=5691 RepID=JBP1_TRYBB|eukprot:XP_011780668.1 j-binding protein, putative [Trypanosoma brucei gambiense DAL972]
MRRQVKKVLREKADDSMKPGWDVYQPSNDVVYAFNHYMQGSQIDAEAREKAEKAFQEAVKKHPFHNNADHAVDFHGTTVFRNAKGKVCGVLIPKALPSFATSMAADVLECAVARTSLRSALFGGVSPNSGIAGYFDYRGTPVELKCRKTSFTYEHTKEWRSVFPMIDYTSAIYKAALPDHWKAQDAAVPDVVRIHGSPFSTLTVNERFRTASHTDNGDFDNGYGVLAVLKGEYSGLSLALDDYGVCFNMQPTDVLLFDTHLFHSNTELEAKEANATWNRLSCVFYYRAALGEQPCVEEYRRRLKKAKEEKSTSLSFNHIEQKDNGENTNKPAPVYPVPLTPFSCAASAWALRGCAAAMLTRLHGLVRENASLMTELFGEPVEVADGLPRRAPEEIIPVHKHTNVQMHYLGGFSEKGDILNEAMNKRHYLDKENLQKMFGEEFVNIWTQSRTHWLQLVKKEWEHQKETNPTRTRFSWNNTSAMNFAFFDLCDVAKQLMCGAFGDREVNKKEEQSFWGMFAAHLDNACINEIGMLQGSMGMHKLNVKLKDYNFGGTRYLKDMPPEEQERRRRRRLEIEQARRRAPICNSESGDWLRNEAFDYQTEDVAVNYEREQWITPENNAKRFGFPERGVYGAEGAATGTISVLIVLPKPTNHRQKTCELPTSREADRIMKNPAAQRLLCAKPCNIGLSTSSNKSRTVLCGNIRIDKVFDGGSVGGKMYDFVIMRHLLAATTGEREPLECLVRWTSLARYCTFVVEVDLLDRHHYILKSEIGEEYSAVSEICFSALYSATYARDKVNLRTTPCLLSFIDKSGNMLESRFKFNGSPLNTVAFVVRRREK